MKSLTLVLVVAGTVSLGATSVPAQTDAGGKFRSTVKPGPTRLVSILIKQVESRCKTCSESSCEPAGGCSGKSGCGATCGRPRVRQAPCYRPPAIHCPQRLVYGGTCGLGCRSGCYPRGTIVTEMLYDLQGLPSRMGTVLNTVLPCHRGCCSDCRSDGGCPSPVTPATPVEEADEVEPAILPHPPIR